MITDEIARIINAKQEIAKAIEAKGVEVPTLTLIDQFPSLIADIPTGGGWHSDNPLHFSTTSTQNKSLTINTSRLLEPEISYDGKLWTEFEGGNITMRAKSELQPNNIDNLYLRAKAVLYGTTAIISTSAGVELEGNFSSLIESSSGKMYPYCFMYALDSYAGDINELEFPEDDIIPKYACQCMFINCKTIKKGLSIKATTVDSYGCASMYSGCSEMTTSPDVNFITVNEHGCDSMFQNCYKLAEVPFLNGATEVGTYGYYQMFSGCTVLKTKANSKLITTVAPGTYAYSRMFMNTGIIEAPEIETLNHGGNPYMCYSMFQGCKSLTKAPSVLDFESKGKSYLISSMFNGCTSLVESPRMRFTTITTTGTVSNAFSGCTNLNKIYVVCDSWNTSYATNWVNGVAATGEFHKNPGVTIPTGTGGIPSGWTVIEDLE